MQNEIELTKIAEPVFGITPHRYRQLAREGVLPSPEKGKINLLESTREVISYYRSKAEAGGGKSLTDERTRLTRLNADRRALENEKARGETIDTAKAMKLWSVVMENISKKIDQIPAKLPPLAHGLTIPEIKAVTEQMIYEIRNEIANPDLRELAKSGTRKRAGAVTPGKRKQSKRRIL
jgi:phage terminase Nu1 subunit (DNA packaging protein)